MSTRVLPPLRLLGFGEGDYLTNGQALVQVVRREGDGYAVENARSGEVRWLHDAELVVHWRTVTRG